MPRTIQIDDDVVSILERNARPFVDSENDVLRRLLGLESSTNGRTPVDRQRIADPGAAIDDPVILIRINKRYRPDLSPEELYDVTRRAWRVNPALHQAQYALAVYDGVVREVYEIHEWHEAEPRPDSKTWEKGEKWAFEGAVAPEALRSKYMGSDVKHYFKPGAQNPITYVNC